MVLNRFSQGAMGTPALLDATAYRALGKPKITLPLSDVLCFSFVGQYPRVRGRGVSRGNSQRFFNRPSVFVNAQRKQCFLKPKVFPPLSESFCDSVPSQVASVTPVQDLLVNSGPAYIVRLIVAVVIRVAIKGISLAGPRANFFKNIVPKGFIRSVPLRTQTDAPATVACIVMRMGISRPLSNRLPSSIQTGCCSLRAFSVSYETMSNFLTIQTATAFGLFCFQSNGGHMGECTAAAYAVPRNEPCSSWGLSQNSQSVEVVANFDRGIYSAGSHHESSFSVGGQGCFGAFDTGVARFRNHNQLQRVSKVTGCGT